MLDRSRGARSIGLTREGQILLRYATEIVARFEAAAAHLLGGAARRPASAASAASAAPRSPSQRRRSRRVPDDVRVALVELPDEEAALDLLADGDLELAFAVAPVRKGFATTVLRHEGDVAVVPRCDRRELAVEELDGRRVIVDGTPHGAMLAQVALAAGASEVRVVEDKTIAAALGAAGVGVALLPELSYTAATARALVLAWQDERPRTVAALQFIRAVTALAHAARARAA